MKPNPYFGRLVKPGRYRVFCHDCGLPMEWPERPKVQNYYCDDCDTRPNTPIPSRPSAGATREEDGGNTFDDAIGMIEDGGAK